MSARAKAVALGTVFACATAPAYALIVWAVEQAIR